MSSRPVSGQQPTPSLRVALVALGTPPESRWALWQRTLGVFAMPSLAAQAKQVRQAAAAASVVAARRAAAGPPSRFPAPEPRFKLSNFMRVLGDQAVADPSKVEKKVLEQIKQRLTNHEMRNQAQKLTPQERREKKRRKMHEDTSTQVHVCLFRVADLSEPWVTFARP